MKKFFSIANDILIWGAGICAIIDMIDFVRTDDISYGIWAIIMFITFNNGIGNKERINGLQ